MRRSYAAPSLPILGSMARGRTTHSVTRIRSNLPSSYQAFLKKKKKKAKDEPNHISSNCTLAFCRRHGWQRGILTAFKKGAALENLPPFFAQIQSDRFIMWYELRALALANHNNYVIHMQTLCHSVIRDRIFTCRGLFFPLSSSSSSAFFL